MLFRSVVAIEDWMACSLALKTAVGSPLSKKILFVAIARTLGIPARLNPEDRSMEYRENGKFVPVLPEAEKNCCAVLKAEDGTQWKYFQNWSMAKLTNGTYTSLRLGGLEWNGNSMETELEAGQYMTKARLWGQRAHVSIRRIKYREEYGPPGRQRNSRSRFPLHGCPGCLHRK